MEAPCSWTQVEMSALQTLNQSRTAQAWLSCNSASLKFTLFLCSRGDLKSFLVFGK